MKVFEGTENLILNNKSVNRSIIDFWRWNGTDLINNTVRGDYAEFLVASALDLDITQSHVDWESYALLWNDIRIEVKCSSHLQSWRDKPTESIIYSIAPAYEWQPNKESYSDNYGRHSDVHVFCLYTSLDKAPQNPLNLDNWEFYVVSTKRLDNIFTSQKTVSLKSLIKHALPIMCKYDELADAITKESKSKF